jgi:DNA adenine methylase
MQFQGGKARQAKAIGQLLKTVDRPCYLEPFVGGAWVLKEVAQHFPKVTASDLHLDLILLYQALQEGWEPPTDVTEEEYQAQRQAEPSPFRAFCGYACSFGGKWFGGYARGHTSPGTGARSLLRKAGLLESVLFSHCDYGDHSPGPADVVYCDPPYRNRTPLKQVPPFDHQRFWNTMNEWAEAGATVFVSEEQATEGWVPVLNPGRNTCLGVDNEKSHIPEAVWRRL